MTMASPTAFHKTLGVRLTDILDEPRTMLAPIEGYDKMPLVSIEEAIEPLCPLVRDVKRRAWMGKLNCENPPDNLTPDESAAIWLYTMEWEPHNDSLYYVLNSTLRAKERGKLKPWFLFLKLLFTGLSRIPPLGNRTVYRGVRQDISHLYTPGKPCIWWGFSSCTLNIGVLDPETFLGRTGPRTLFTIDCFSGKEIHQHSYIQKESEILLLPGTQFEIVGNINPSPDFHIIQLKEVQGLYQLLEPVSGDHVAVKKLVSNPPSKKMFSGFDVPKVFSRILLRDSEHNRNLRIEKRIAKFCPSSMVDLDRQSLTDEDIPTVIEQALVEKKCTMLRLSDNKITENGVSILAKSLQTNTTLEGLYIFNNQISDNGVYYLLQAFSTGTLKLRAISIGWNNITDRGAEHLAEILKKNDTLIELWLPRNEISDKGVQVLADVLIHHNRALQRLSLDLNKRITDRSVSVIIDIIKETRSLRALHLCDCGLSKTSKTRLQEVAQLKQNFELKL